MEEGKDDGKQVYESVSLSNTKEQKDVVCALSHPKRDVVHIS